MPALVRPTAQACRYAAQGAPGEGRAGAAPTDIPSIWPARRNTPYKKTHHIRRHIRSEWNIDISFITFLWPSQGADLEGDQPFGGLAEMSVEWPHGPMEE